MIKNFRFIKSSDPQRIKTPPQTSPFNLRMNSLEAVEYYLVNKKYWPNRRWYIWGYILWRWELDQPIQRQGWRIFSHSSWPVIHQFRRWEIGRPTQSPGRHMCYHSRWTVIHPGRWRWRLPDPEVCGVTWEDGTGPGVTTTSLKNVNILSADEVKMRTGREK